ncbi:Uncharacterized protein TCM_027262 [Theobroma cacao]|uniref:Uncharacterized protein n=1 Tax=Theobroma cacao TaxID=3641 RepID=A0A061G9R1_THECC|nr:Uncharacterized protein TCM_027262 [Theobroma cacao]
MVFSFFSTTMLLDFCLAIWVFLPTIFLQDFCRSCRTSKEENSLIFVGIIHCY